MKAVLFEIYFEGGKDALPIDRKYRPRIETYSDNTCAIVGKCPKYIHAEQKVFARFGINHSVVCKGEVYLKDLKDSHSIVVK